MFGIIKKIFIALLTSVVNAANHTKCVSLSNQKWLPVHIPTSLHIFC